MERQLLTKLLKWKESSQRNLLIISGAEGVGKSFLLTQLLGRQFNQVYQFDLNSNPELFAHLNASMQPNQFLSLLELIHGAPIDVNGLIVLSGLDTLNQSDSNNDTSLSASQFAHFIAILQRITSKASALFIACCCVDTSSLSRQQLHDLSHYVLRPLSFYEFLQASPHRALVKTLEKQVISPAAHSRLNEQFKDYCFTGGMPEAVATWFKPDFVNITERIKAVCTLHQQHFSQLQQAMLTSNLPLAPLRALLNHVAKQLACATSDSVHRFKFKGVFQQKNRYQDFSTAIAWLANQHWLLLNYPVHGTVSPPLSDYRKASMVKLFIYDIGLLHHILGVDYQRLKFSSNTPSYAIQSFVQQELAAQGISPSYSWQDARAEIEFIIPHSSGAILPLEVKSSLRTRAKSLPSYQQKCNPTQLLKLHSDFPPTSSDTTHHWPLYHCQFALELLVTEVTE